MVLDLGWIIGVTVVESKAGTIPVQRLIYLKLHDCTGSSVLIFLSRSLRLVGLFQVFFFIFLHSLHLFIASFRHWACPNHYHLPTFERFLHIDNSLVIRWTRNWSIRFLLVRSYLPSTRIISDKNSSLSGVSNIISSKCSWSRGPDVLVCNSSELLNAARESQY